MTFEPMNDTDTDTDTETEPKLNPQMEQPDMLNFIYPVALERDEDGRHLVTFLDFPEALTDGATVNEALDEAMDCLAEAVAGRIDRGELIPAPTRQRGGYRVVLTPQMAAKAALYTVMHESHVANAELARRLEIDEKEIRRMLDPHHATKLPRITEAMRELGQQIVLSVKHA